MLYFVHKGRALTLSQLEDYNVCVFLGSCFSYLFTHVFPVLFVSLHAIANRRTISFVLVL